MAPPTQPRAQVSKERRKEPRIGLNVPVHVHGFLEDGTTWEEMTMSEDTSSGGASFLLKYPVRVGLVLLVALPLPKRFRRHDLAEAFRTYALVRSARAEGASTRVGVMFLGKTPPRGFQENPGALYLLPTDPKPSSQERRRFPRLELFLNLKLLWSGREGPREETTVAENLGKHGARVLTTLPLSKGEVVVVEELGGTFRARAEVRNIYVGADHIPRLNLCFLDTEAPARLVSIG